MPLPNLHTAPSVKKRKGMLFAWPYFVPAWLYLPYLLYATPAFGDVNENLLALLLAGPQAVALLVLIPLRQGRITWREVWLFLGLPLLVGFAAIFLVLNSD